MPKFALLTGGGDAPGLNGILESVSRTLLRQGIELVGILDGFEGIFGGRTKPVTLNSVEGIHQEAGTFLGTSNRSKVDGREEEFLTKFAALGVDGLIVAGGDGTFAALAKVAEFAHSRGLCSKDEVPFKVIGLPKTIDNDLSGTEITFGFDTACSVVADAVDALRATANAHQRIMVVEAMGRTAGWIALGGGMAAYADAILIPERPYDPQKLLEFIRREKTRKRGLVLSVAEGAHAIGEQSGGRVAAVQVAERLARWFEKETGVESRHVVLGYLQRSAHPTTTDRFLTLAMGAKAAELALRKQWGRGVVYRNGEVIDAPLSDLQGPPRLVDSNHRWVKMAQAVGLWI